TVIDLMPTTGTIGGNDDLFPRLLDGREQFKPSHLHTHPIMFFFVPEGTGHPTTAGGDYGNLIIRWQIEDIKGNLLIGYGFLMAMDMDLYGLGLFGELIGRKFTCRKFPGQKFLYQIGIFGNGLHLVPVDAKTFVLVPKGKDS